MRGSFILGLAAVLLIQQTLGQPITMQSVVRYVNFTSQYSMEYFTHNLNNVPTVRFTLRYLNYDITNWGSQGANGIWMGIGFGQQIMDGSDIYQCQLSYTGNPSIDLFVCNDRYA